MTINWINPSGLYNKNRLDFVLGSKTNKVGYIITLPFKKVAIALSSFARCFKRKQFES